MIPSMQAGCCGSLPLRLSLPDRTIRPQCPSIENSCHGRVLTVGFQVPGAGIRTFLRAECEPHMPPSHDTAKPAHDVVSAAVRFPRAQCCHHHSCDGDRTLQPHRRLRWPLTAIQVSPAEVRLGAAALVSGMAELVPQSRHGDSAQASTDRHWLTFAHTPPRLFWACLRIS